MPILNGNGFCLRPYRRGDEEALARVANNPAIAGNMASIFPSPYTLKDAEAWITRSESAPEGELSLAIDIDGMVCGGIGIHVKVMWSPDTYEMGYWLGELYWGRGIVTQAAGILVQYAFNTLGAERVQAFAYEWNPASRRVLEKNGFLLEGRLRRAVCKNGRRGDVWAFGRLRAPA